MKVLNRHQFTGLEFDWIAVDADCHLGLFSTGGYGPVPEIVSRPDYMDDLYDNLSDLEPRGQARLEINPDYDVSEWLALSQKGLYVYDWSSAEELYQGVSSPTSPLELNEFTSNLEEVALLVGLKTNFATREPISLSTKLIR